MDQEMYSRHKTLPPKVWIDPKARNPRTRAIGYRLDRPRAMTEEERRWWTSPYLRMLSSPLRSCQVSKESLPADLQIRLAPMLLPAPRGARKVQILVPDGLEHPRFRRVRNGSAIYMLCKKSFVNVMAARRNLKGVQGNIVIHSRLAEQIGHLLRIRVLQEIEILADRLQCRPTDAQDHPVLRRLSRAEWSDVRNTGVIPYEGAIALLVVPPLNKNPVTKQRTTPSFSSTPPGETDKISAKPLPPLCVLHPTSTEGRIDEDTDSPAVLPNAAVPLYNGLSLFPSRPQRAALHAALNKLLFVERRARWREHGRPDSDENPSTSVGDTRPQKADKWARGDQKASHAYLLCADSESVLRADAVPVAIALWRIRMWEGAELGYRASPDKRWKLKMRPLPS
ncbi:hypothetical protein EIP86_001843 [Pleurotus ostreatoroseus]|nr:hypothetical protein EIP86_001843 [Pleurotus ostreatoroseus]